MANAKQAMELTDSMIRELAVIASRNMDLTDDMIRELAVIASRNEKGEHFTQWSDHYEMLEQSGMVAITRPVSCMGMPYGTEYWSIELTEEGQGIVGYYPELHSR